MPGGTVSDGATVDRLSHENGVPFPGPGHVDNVFPTLRGQPLTENCPQPLDAQALQGRSGSIVAGSCRAVSNEIAIAVNVPGLAQPVGYILRKVFPYVARDVVVASIEIEILRGPIGVAIRVRRTSEITEELIPFISVVAIVL